MEETKLTIHLPLELSRRAKARAALEGTTLSEVIRHSLEEFTTVGKKILNPGLIKVLLTKHSNPSSE